ncbi:putative membrane protein [Bacillus sp. SORGH_AS 510]|nr:putative membrane protein [Bacillus sp. SORGH_AS_0510]
MSKILFLLFFVLMLIFLILGVASYLKQPKPKTGWVFLSLSIISLIGVIYLLSL